MQIRAANGHCTHLPSSGKTIHCVAPVLPYVFRPTLPVTSAVEVLHIACTNGATSCERGLVTLLSPTNSTSTDGAVFTRLSRWRHVRCRAPAVAVCFAAELVPSTGAAPQRHCRDDRDTGNGRAEPTIARDTATVFGGLGATQLNWQPGAASWSIAQCFDHL
jgi:hypothetical protein